MQNHESGLEQYRIQVILPDAGEGPEVPVGAAAFAGRDHNVDVLRGIFRGTGEIRRGNRNCRGRSAGPQQAAA